MKQAAPARPKQVAVWNLPQSIQRNIKRKADAEGRSVSGYLKQYLIREFGDSPTLQEPK